MAMRQGQAGAHAKVHVYVGAESGIGLSLQQFCLQKIPRRASGGKRQREKERGHGREVVGREVVRNDHRGPGPHIHAFTSSL